MPTLNRWEAEIIVPTGGWDVALVEDAPISDSGTATVTAGTYTWATFLAELVTQLGAAASNTYTVTVDDGDGGTGRTTITAVAPNDFSLTWTDTDLRDLLGYTATVTGGQVYVSPSHVKGMWLPDCAHVCSVSFGDEIDVSDRTTLLTPDATNASYLAYNRVRELVDLRYQHITRAKARIVAETYANQSFGTFWRDVIDGDQSYFRIGKVRIFPDADTDATSYQYWIGDGLSAYRPANIREGWQGLWTITIPRLVRVET